MLATLALVGIFLIAAGIAWFPRRWQGLIAGGLLLALVWWGSIRGR